MTMATRAGWSHCRRQPGPSTHTDRRCRTVTQTVHASAVPAERSPTDLCPTDLSPDATRPRVTERPEPPELLGATHSVDPARPDAESCRTTLHLAPDRSALADTSTRPRTTSSVTYGLPGPGIQPGGPAFRPILRHPPVSGEASASRTIHTVMGGSTGVKRVGRNPYLFLHISRSVPRFGRDVHRSSPAPADRTSLPGALGRGTGGPGAC